MALVKFGAGVSEMRGKEGGVIYSRNAYGSYIKTKVSPINPQTARQLEERTLMGNQAQNWAGLSASEKAGWVNLGSQVTRINRFGDTTNYSGFSLFMKCNRNIVLAGGSAVDEAPTVPTIPVLNAVSVTAGLGIDEINLTFTPTPVPAGYAMLVYMTNNILTGRSFVKNYYRFICKVAAAQTSPQELKDEWAAVFSNVMVVGARIFVKAKLVHLASGFEGVASTCDCVVTA